MKRLLRASFVLMGFSLTASQTLLLREFLVAFFGNELSIGLVLGNWLVLEAVGSGLLGKLADRWGQRPAAFALLQILLALFLPLSLLAVHFGRRLVGAVPGEGLGLIPIFWSSLLILVPLGLVAGAMFAFGCRVYGRLTAGEEGAIGRVYVLEALGGIAGGLVFTYLFLPHLHSVHVVLILSTLNLIAAASIAGSAGMARSVRALILSLAAAALLVLLTPLADAAERWLVSRQWPGYELVYSEHSVYGHVAAVERQGQFTFFADGVPVLSAPLPDVTLNEEMVHLPLLFVRQPQRALVLSGGLGGVIHELAKYPLDQIDYAELDPLLIEAVQAVPSELTKDELADPRLRVETVDGRLLVRHKLATKGERMGYDLILINLPYPSSLQLNRFYTAEFLGMVRELLAEGGVAVIRMPGSLSYLDAALQDLNAMAWQTLQQAFPHVRPIPGEVTLWLASPSDEIETASLASLQARWRARGLETQWLTSVQIERKLEPRYLDWFWAALDDSTGNGVAAPNRDLQPLGLFYGLVYWNSLFAPWLARLFALIGQLELWLVAALIGLAGVLTLLLARRSARSRRPAIPLAIAATGLAGIAADLVIILAFQTLYGHVYQWLGLLVTAFMAGLALGGWLTNRGLVAVPAPPAADRTRIHFLGLEIGLIAFWLFLALALAVLYTRSRQPWLFAAGQPLLLLSNAIAGGLVGAQFPLANRLWLRDRRVRGREGILYASDLAGAFLGAVGVSVILVPVLGIVETCLAMAILKAASLLLACFLPKAGQCLAAQ